MVNLFEVIIHIRDLNARFKQQKNKDCVQYRV